MFKTESKLLFDEQPLVLLRGLAKAVGITDAIVLQQVNYWLNINKKAGKNFYDGRYWVYNTIREWQENDFYFMSFDGVKKAFARLESKGLLIIGNYNVRGYDRTRWYSIDYDALDSLSDDNTQFNARKAARKANSDSIPVVGYIVPKASDIAPNHHGDNVPNGRVQSNQPIPEITSEITAETTTERKDLCSPAESGSVNPHSKTEKAETEKANQASQGEHLTVKSARDCKNQAMTLANERFDLFYQQYPLKRAKKVALKAWQKINPDEELFNKIMAALGSYKQYCTRTNTLFCYPATWLNQERWNDDSTAAIAANPVNKGENPFFHSLQNDIDAMNSNDVIDGCNIPNSDFSEQPQGHHPFTQLFGVDMSRPEPDTQNVVLIYQNPSD